ncbi:MAG: DnaA N-terminal domain-containing protein [Anaerolineae bacterium]
MPADDKLLQLQGVYNTLYNSITRPDFKFAVTRYFIDEWAPLLGPSLAWLVVGLRQQCFWNQRRDWCIVDKATLARETVLDERTIERGFKKTFSDWFVLEISHRYQYRTQLGKKVRDKNRYHLLLDDPLAPRHQLGLAALLRHSMPVQGDPLDQALGALQTILALPDLSGKIAHTGPWPSDLPRRTVLELAAESAGLSLVDFAGDARVISLDQMCSRLYNLIVQPNKVYIGWQYFRLKWLPLLGHSLAWLIIYMRRQCYWDESSGELRDTLLAFKKELAAAIGQTPRNLANLLENEYLPLFFTTLNAAQPANDGDSAPTAARNKPILYQIRMVDEPLTPEDQLQVAQELRQRLNGSFYARDPEHGQLNMFPALNFLSNRQKFAYGQVAEKMSPSESKKGRLDDMNMEILPQHAGINIGKNVATLKDSSLPSDSEKEQQAIPSQVAAARIEALQTILDDLEIQEPVRSRLLADPYITVTKIAAWFLYAETQTNLRDPQGYVIKRLLTHDPPPEKFVAFAKMDDATWSCFEESVQQLRLGQLPEIALKFDLIDTFVNWAEVYAGLDPTQTRYLLSAGANSAPYVTPVFLASESTDPKRDAGRNFWRDTLVQLQLQVPRQTFETWLKQTEVLDYREDILVVDAKTAFAKDWLENRLMKVIEATLSGVIGAPTQVRFALAE